MAVEMDLDEFVWHKSAAVQAPTKQKKGPVSGPLKRPKPKPYWVADSNRGRAMGKPRPKITAPVAAQALGKEYCPSCGEGRVGKKQWCVRCKRRRVFAPA